MDNTKCNCLINGYPHFVPPKSVLLAEVESFINPRRNYPSNSFVIIRFGDTHTDRPLPSLSQLRNIALAKAWRAVCKAYCLQPKLVYGLGDFGDRLYSSLETTSIPASVIRADIHEFLYKYGKASIVVDQWKSVSVSAKQKVRLFLNKYGFDDAEIILESDVFSNHIFFDKVVKESGSFDQVREDGSPTYLLNELLWIEYLSSKSGSIISLITSNQMTHINSVKRKIESLNKYSGFSFHIYERCNNGFIFDSSLWTNLYEETMKNVFYGLEHINSEELFYRILFIGSRNNCRIDFANLSLYRAIFNRTSLILNAIHLGKERQSANNQVDINTLMMMSLARSRLLTACNRKEFSTFIEYLYSVAVSGIQHNSVSPLLSLFLETALHYIGILE